MYGKVEKNILKDKVITYLKTKGFRLSSTDSSGGSISLSFEKEFENYTYKIELLLDKDNAQKPWCYILDPNIETDIMKIFGVKYDIKEKEYSYYLPIAKTKYQHSEKLLSINSQIYELGRKSSQLDNYIDLYFELFIKDIDEVIEPFLDMFSKNPYIIAELDDIEGKYDFYKGAFSFYKYDIPLYVGWYISRIWGANKIHRADLIDKYLVDFENNLTINKNNFPPENEGEYHDFCCEIFERTKKVFKEGIDIDSLGARNTQPPLVIGAGSICNIFDADQSIIETTSNHLHGQSEPISDEEVDQFGNIDILGNYFINAYRADFGAAYIAAAKVQYGITYELIEKGELSLEDTLEALDPKQVFFCANEENNYTIVSFEKWGDSEILKTYGTDLTEQQKVLLSLFPNQDIVGISFQETTGCAGLVEIKKGQKSRGFYSIVGEIEVIHGQIGASNNPSPSDLFGIQNGIFSKFFKHPINEALLYQDVSVLKRK